MMKRTRLFLILVLVTAWASCKQQPADNRDADPQVSADTISTAAENSWLGTYSGTTPCSGDCTGIDTKMEIVSDSTYNLSLQNLGRDDQPRLFKGTFYKDVAKNVITLDAEGDHLKFRIQNGSLLMLDKFGDLKQGGNPQDYILRKQ